MGTDIHAWAEIRQGGKWVRSPVKVPDGRCYRTFAKLADVRNDGGIHPIAEPRGLPDDADMPPEFDGWCGDHSFSWVTLAEMLAVDPYEPLKITALVKADDKELLDKYGIFPSEWCGWTNAPGYVEASWVVPYIYYARLFSRLVMSLRPLGSPEDVRLVFGFDS